MTIDKARRRAFDVWKEFDDRVKIADKTVTDVDRKLSEYNDKLYHSTRKYDESPKLYKLWSEWLSATYRENNDYANSLGFSTRLGESYAPDFAGDKFFASPYRDYWIEQAVGRDDVYVGVGVGTVNGAFDRFVKFENYCVRSGFVNELDEDGYTKIENIIGRCFEYLSSEVEPKVRDYVKLMRYVEDKVADAENSCAVYIDEHLKNK